MPREVQQFCTFSAALTEYTNLGARYPLRQTTPHRTPVHLPRFLVEEGIETTGNPPTFFPFGGKVAAFADRLADAICFARLFLPLNPVNGLAYPLDQ